MRILVLGGTGLSGTAVVHEALERGHSVVAVHRGRSNTLDVPTTALLTEVVHDRADGHAPIAQHGPFDAVIDVSARVPAWVADAVQHIRTDHWVQYSSVSAYADLARGGVDEQAPLAQFSNPELERRATTDPHVEFDYEWYAETKAACERVLLDGAGAAGVSIVRPVLITGAHDTTWRVPYWVERVRNGGRLLAPPANDPIQVIDARDLATFALDLAEQRRAGAWNAAPLAGTQTIGSLLEACGASPGDVVHGTREWLDEHDVEPWSDLPAWMPDGLGFTGIVTCDARTAERDGLRCRPLTDTVAWITEWQLRDRPAHGSAGLDPVREQELLAEC